MVVAQPWLLCVVLLGWCCPALLGCPIWRGCVEVYMLAPRGAVWDLTVHLRLSQAVLQPTRLSPELGFHKQTVHF